MTVTLQILDAKTIMSEKGIGLGLSSCRREGVQPVPKTDKKNGKTQFYQFFDASCVWSFLHPIEEQNIIENKFKADKDIYHMQTQHLVRFIFIFILFDINEFIIITLFYLFYFVLF